MHGPHGSCQYSIYYLWNVLRLHIAKPFTMRIYQNICGILVPTYVPNLCELDTCAWIGGIALSTSVQVCADSARDRAARVTATTVPCAVRAYVEMDVI